MFSIRSLILACACPAILAAAPPPIYLNSTALPTTGSTAFTRLPDGGAAAAFYRLQSIIEMVEVRQYSRGGEVVFSLLLPTKRSMYASTILALPDSSFLVAGYLSSQDSCQRGGWVARFKNREEVWRREYCPDGPGFRISIQNAMPKGTDRILLVGPGAPDSGIATVSFLEIDGSGAKKDSATTRIPGAAILEFVGHLRADASERIFIAYAYAKDSEPVSGKVVMRFDAAYRLLYQKTFKSERVAGDYRIRPDGGLSLIGAISYGGASDQNWLLQLDREGKTLLDTSYVLLDSLDGKYVPPEDPKACREDDSLGLLLAYGHLDRVAVLKVDRNGKKVYHKKYKVYAETGVLPNDPAKLGSGMVFLNLGSSRMNLIAFDPSGSHCASIALTWFPENHAPNITTLLPNMFFRNGRTFTASGKAIPRKPD